MREKWALEKYDLLGTPASFLSMLKTLNSFKTSVSSKLSARGTVFELNSKFSLFHNCPFDRVVVST